MDNFVAVVASGIVYVGWPTPYIAQGEFHGDIVDHTGAVVGMVVWPVLGAVEVGNFVWITTTQDLDANGFKNGEDYDLYMEWFTQGWIMADYNADGFVNAEDVNLYTVDFLQGS